jgi:hypothetical protein
MFKRLKSRGVKEMGVVISRTKLAKSRKTLEGSVEKMSMPAFGPGVFVGGHSLQLEESMSERSALSRSPIWNILMQFTRWFSRLQTSMSLNAKGS